MTQAKCGDTVKVHFTGRLENGEVFTSSRASEPLEFTLGSGQVIPGFEKAITGMEVGETKTVTLPPEEAYGPRYEDLVVDVKSCNFPEDITPLIGEQLEIPQEDGEPLKVTVADVSEDTVSLDANHPLAGYRLTFTIILVAVK
jgi:FKBP-type peptidyl-prolyl cis-trans isomerase 2